ncbi:MAG: ATP-binding protein [Candidatus Margulisiibacteriota bacterium]
MRDKFLELLRKYPILTVTGPRQSGKTTFLKALLPHYTYVSLENVDLREFAGSDPKRFLNEYPAQVIIDEAQHVPQLFSYIQTLVDEDRIPGRFVLSGSQNFLLSQSVSQSLAGRTGIFKMLPLSIQELRESDQLPELDMMIVKGGYPAIYAHHFDPQDWYADYVETYLQKDVSQIKKITDLRAFKNFLMQCAVRNGQVLNMSSLGRDCGVSHNTIREWLAVLEASYIIFLLEPYTAKLSTRLIKAPKLYFLDSGLLAHLLRIANVDQLKTNPYRGPLFESLVISDLIKAFFCRKQRFLGSYLRDTKGHEVDLIMESANEKKMVEIKSGSTIQSAFFGNLTYFQDKLGDSVSAWVVYGGDTRHDRSSASIVPWRQLPDPLVS